MHESGHIKGSKKTKKVLQNQNSNFEEADFEHQKLIGRTFRKGNGSEDTKAPRNHETKTCVGTQTTQKDPKRENRA